MSNILVIIFFISALQLYSGLNSQSKIDSMMFELSNARGDTNHVILLSLISYELEASNTEKGIKYGLEGIDLAKQIKYKRGEADCNLYVGRNYFAEKDFNMALLYYNKSLILYKEIGDKKAISYNYEYFANLYSHQSNYPLLLKYLKLLLKLNKELGNKIQTADQLNNIGLVNLYLSKYNEALESFNESYLINSEINDSFGMGFNIINSARVYKELEEFDKALVNFRIGLKIFRNANDVYNLSRINYFIADIYFQESNYQKSLYYVNNAINDMPIDSVSKKFQVREYAKSLILKSELLFEMGEFSKSIDLAKAGLNFSKNIKYKDGIASNYSNLGKVYSKLYQFDSDSKLLKISINYFSKAEAIFSSLGELDKRSQNLKYLSKAYELNGKIKKSYRAFQKYVILKDSIFNEENIKKIGKLESDFKYKIKLNKSEKDRLIAQKREELAKSQNSKLQVIVLTLLILTALFIWLYMRRKKNIRIIEEKNNLIVVQRKDIEVKNKQLIKMNIAKDKIFGTISHDLQNTVKGFIIGTKDKKANIEYINQSALKMKELLNSLLTYADKNFNQFELEVKIIDLSELIEETLKLYSNEIISKNLSIQKTYDTQTAQSNYSYAEIIVRNIIHNSIKFSTNNGKIEINLSTEDNYTILKIKDYGIGIPESDIEKINNYQRPKIQNPIGNISKGTGFGLVTSKEFIEKIDGNLFIESKIGKGTIVLLYFQS